MMKWCIVAGLFIASLASAHQEKTADTHVLIKPQSGLIELSHRLYVHDAEHLMKIAFEKKGFDLLSDSSARDELAAYVTDNFELDFTSYDKKQKELIGSEVEGKFFWVYQIIPIPEAFKELNALQFKFRDSILMDGIPKQTNLVHLEYLNEVETLVFKSNDTWQFLVLDLEH